MIMIELPVGVPRWLLAARTRCPQFQSLSASGHCSQRARSHSRFLCLFQRLRRPSRSRQAWRGSCSTTCSSGCFRASRTFAVSQRASARLDSTQGGRSPWIVCQERLTLRDAAPNKAARANGSDWESSWGRISRCGVYRNQLHKNWNPNRDFGWVNLGCAKRAARQHCRGGRSCTIRSAASHFFVIDGLPMVSPRHRATGRWCRARGTGAAQQRQRYRDGKKQFDHMLAPSDANLRVKVATTCACLHAKRNVE